VGFAPDAQSFSVGVGNYEVGVKRASLRSRKAPDLTRPRIYDAYETSELRRSYL